MTLEERVHSALDNSVENGYEQELVALSIKEIALDLTDCDADLEHVDYRDLEPHVQSWLQKKGLT